MVRGTPTAGLGGVVTEWTARTYAAPTHTVSAGFSAATADAASLESLLAECLKTAHRFTSSSYLWGSVGVRAHRLPGGQGFTAGVSGNGWELSRADAEPLLAPIVEWAAAHKANVSGASTYYGGWNASSNAKSRFRPRPRPSAFATSSSSAVTNVRFRTTSFSRGVSPL